MKIIHSADWHLGKLINNVFMTEDQAYILDRLKDRLIETNAEVLIVAGDVYDRSIPPVEAVSLLNAFISDIIETLSIKVIMCSGNHDSSERLSFGSNLLRKKGLYIVGKSEQGYETITLKGKMGETVAFHVIPYMTAFEARQRFDQTDIKSSDDLMAHITDAIKKDMDKTVQNVVVGHGFIVGTEMPEESDSERPLNIGGTDAISFRHLVDFDYVALGHLHNPQKAGREYIRYSGSLLKYSFSENQAQKGIVEVDLKAPGEKSVNFISLNPLRDMRVIKGPLEGLTSSEVALEHNNEDYIHAILTDRGALMDPMNTLRSVYPNILSMEIQASEINENVNENLEIRREKDPVNLFDMFHQVIEGTELEDHERTFIEEIVEYAIKGEA